MLMVNSTCYNDSELDIPNYDYPIVAISAGHHQLITCPHFWTDRPGRRDYQLLYVKNGHIQYYIGDTKFSVPAGGFLLYRPEEPQHYEYFLDDNADIYWVHFTGKNVKNLLSSLGFNKHTGYTENPDNRYEYYFNEIINELLYRKPHFMEFSSLLMQALLLYISRSCKLNKNTSQKENSYVEQIHEILNQNYQQSINFSNLAKEFHVSPSQLTKSFTVQYGVSPSKYLTNLRIEKAKALLLTKISVNQTATLVGYSDQLYFSKVFHKIVGVSPSQYRDEQFDPSLITKWNNGVLIKRNQKNQKEDV